MNSKKKIIIAITGASGSIYAKLLIERLMKCNNQVDIDNLALIFSEMGKQVFEYELQCSINDIKGVKFFDNNDFFAPFASGSSSYETMIIIPCSMGTLGRISHGVSDSLITRAADVMLKENKKLVIVPRETPYNLIHLQNMQLLKLAGATIVPASPSFYSLPLNIEDLCLSVVERILTIIGIDIDKFEWKKNN